MDSTISAITATPRPRSSTLHDPSASTNQVVILLMQALMFRARASIILKTTSPMRENTCFRRMSQQARENSWMEEDCPLLNLPQGDPLLQDPAAIARLRSLDSMTSPKIWGWLRRGPRRGCKTARARRIEPRPRRNKIEVILFFYCNRIIPFVWFYDIKICVGCSVD